MANLSPRLTAAVDRLALRPGMRVLAQAKTACAVELDEEIAPVEALLAR